MHVTFTDDLETQVGGDIYVITNTTPMGDYVTKSEKNRCEFFSKSPCTARLQRLFLEFLVGFCGKKLTPGNSSSRALFRHVLLVTTCYIRVIYVLCTATLKCGRSGRESVYLG